MFLRPYQTDNTKEDMYAIWWPQLPYSRFCTKSVVAICGNDEKVHGQKIGKNLHFYEYSRYSSDQISQKKLLQ
jgi:hypothetical protein